MDVETPLAANTPTTPRFLKRTVWVVVAVLLLLALYFAPQLPAVRAFVLARVQGAAQSAGYRLEYRESSGNPWWNLHLTGAEVKGPGVDVLAGDVGLEYFLPALVTGKLPVSVTAAHVRGAVTLKDFARSQNGDNGPTITPALRDLRLEDVSIDLTDAPYTLPDLTVTNLQARPAGEGFRAEATLQTSEGSADVNGTLSLNPLRFTADVPRADARLARQWWGGVTGGTLSGSVTYADKRLRANASVADGGLTFLGETVTGVTGDLTYQNQTVTADFSGTALGGEVGATGTVNVATRRWSAEARGDVDLRAAALWLAAGRVPVDLSGLPLEGSATTQLRASGWRTVALSGAATGAGTVAGYSLQDLQVDYGFDNTETGRGAEVNATAILAGGNVAATLTPQEEGFSFSLTGADVNVSPTVAARLNLALEQKAGDLSGAADAALTGTLNGEPLQMALNGSLEPNNLRTRIDGTALGSPLTGTVSFQDGFLEGDVTLPEARLPVTKRPVGLNLTASGPPSALPLTLTLTTPKPTGLVLGPLVIPKDVGGQVSATLSGTRLNDLGGSFGTLTVAGDLDLTGQNGALAYSLNPTPLSGVVNGEVGIADGVVTLNDGVLAGTAALTSSGLRVSGVTLPPLEAAPVTFEHADTWTAALAAPDGRLALRYDGDTLLATTAGYPVTAFGQGVELSGKSALTLSDPLGSLDLALTSSTPVGDVTLTGGAAALRFGLETPRFGPGSSLRGTADLRDRTLNLTGQLGALDVSGAGRLEGGNLDGTLNVTGGGENLTVRASGEPARPDVALTGRLPLSLVGDLFDVPASGTLDTDLHLRGGRYEGGAELVGTLQAVPVNLRVTGEGDGLSVTGSATPLDIPLEVGGRLRPTLELTATSKVGRVALDKSGRLTGAGTVPGRTLAGFALEPQPWTLTGSLQEGIALSLPDTGSALTAERGADGWRASLDLNQLLTRGDSRVSVGATGSVSADGPNLNGNVSVQTPAGDAALPFTGSLAGLALTGELPAAVAASLFGSPIGLTGDVSLNARAEVAGGLTYAAMAAWQTPETTLTAQLEGSNSGLSVVAKSDGLKIRYTPETLTVTADRFRLEPFLAAENFQGNLTGNLSRTGDAGWDGELTFATTAPSAVQGVLTGAGEKLELRADYGANGLNAQAVGALLPTPDLTLSGAFRDLATLAGRVGGTLAAPDLAATLTTRALTLQNDLVNVPAQRLNLSAGLAGGLSARVQGDALDVELTGNTLQGRLKLPFTVAGAAETLSADLGGTLRCPNVRGSLAGGLASGPITVADNRLATTLNLDPSPLLTGLSLTAPTLTVTLEGASDLTWQAQLDGSAQLRGLPLALGGAFEGGFKNQGASYRGTATATLAGESVPLTVVGQGGTVQAQANFEAFDLASLAPALPVGLSGTLGGTLAFDSSTPQPVVFDLSAAGTAQGRPFDLTAGRSDGVALSVTGTVDGAPVMLSDDAGAYLLSVGASDRPLSLAGRLEVAPALRLDAAGQYRGQPVTVTAVYAPGETTSNEVTNGATWSASVGSATLSGRAEQQGGAWTVSSRVDSPGDSPLPFTGRAEVAARAEGGLVILDTLTAATTLTGRAVDLGLSGPAWPTPEVAGTLNVAGFERSNLTVTGTDSGYGVGLNYGGSGDSSSNGSGLNLSAEVSSGFALESLALQGTGTLPVGTGVGLTSDLAWTAAAGFSGKAAADLTSGDLSATLTAVGTGPLGVAGRAVYVDREVARLELALSQNPLARPDLNGRLTVQGDVGQTVPAYRSLSATPTKLSSDLKVSGTLTSPRLSGPVNVQGGLDAAGTLNWDGATGRLELAGEDADTAGATTEAFKLEGTADAAGWAVSARAVALSLGKLVPQLAEPRLDAVVSGSGAWGETPRVQISNLSLQTPNGSWQGNLSYDGTLNGRLTADFGLTDLQLGPALQGRVTGDVLIGNASGNETGDPSGSPTLTGTLQATSLGLAGQTATLDGDLIVRGPLAAPDLSLNLHGVGTASGSLSASLAPSKNSYAVTSTLNVGELASDFAVTFGAGDLGASGNLAYRDYALAVGGAGDTLSLTGLERLAGWQLTFVPAAARLDVRGPLAGINDALSGEVALTAAWPPGGGARLSGTLGDVRVGPVVVGNVAVGSSGANLTLTGDRVAADVALQNGVAWTLDHFDAALPGATALTLTGGGTLGSADLTARLSGRVQGEPFDVPAALAYSRGTVTLTSDAALFGGHLTLNAVGQAEAGWQGDLKVEEVSAGGVTVSLAGDVSGPLQTPELAAKLSLYSTASPDTAFTGRLLASPITQTLSGDLTSPLLDEVVSVAATVSPTPALTLETATGETVKLSTSSDGLLTAAGGIELAVGPVTVTLTGQPDTPSEAATLTLSVPRLPGLALTTTLPSVPPAALPAFVADGIVWQGDRDTGGSVVVNLVGGASAELRALSLQTPEGRLEVSGQVAPGAGQVTGRWQGDAAGTTTLPWLAALTDFGFSASLTGDALSVSADGDGSRLDAHYDLGTGTGSLDAILDTPADGTQASAQAALAYDARGPSGELTFTDFPVLTSPVAGDARLNAAVTVTPEAVAGTAALALGDGTLSLKGSLGLASVIPSRFVPAGNSDQNVSARFDAFEVKNVPWVARALPYLSAPVTGAAALHNGALTGELSAPVTVAERTLPVSLKLGGTLAAPEVQGEVERSTFTVSLAKGTVAGLVRFVDFPLDKAVAAVAGPTAVSAQLTGALRFEVPNGVLEKSYIRFSSERFVLEEGGVVTQGDLSFDLENGALTVQKAVFEGVGSWQASGVASRNRLDLRFDASDADFSPLLRLVPQLAGLNVGAFGSVHLVTSGSLVNPVVRGDSPALEVSLGGSAYRLLDTTLTVQNSDFVTSGRLDGVAPLTGSLVFGGGGQVKLAAPRRFDLTLRFSGSPAVPVLGTLENVEGTVSVRPGEPWRLATTGVLGNPFTLEGSLSPLDLRLTGQGLNLKAPRFFLASSLTDTDLRFFRADGYHLAGALQVRQAELDLESRKATADSADGSTAAPSSDTTPMDVTPTDAIQTDETPADGVSATTTPTTETATGPRARSPFLARLNFDDVSLTAPQQISFAENFGSGELGNVDLVLSGTAAQPRLSGAAQGLRGTVRFAGRDFTLQQALATFEPAQGLYPTLDISATTRFDKVQVLAGLADQVGFVEPRSGSDFGVTLSLTGGVVPNPAPDPNAPKPFKVDITPSLSSDAVIEVSGAPSGADTRSTDLGAAAGTRPLSEPELFSLLTLGKLELSPEFAQGSLATSLAQGALDTAVDFLILSELQRGLGDALGLELLEIRTTPLGSLLTGDNAAFGVSLRLGGYLSDEVFASYEVGSLGLGADVSLRNAFNVRYSLGALEFSLAGKLDFYREAGLEPLPEIDLNLGYAFSPLVRLETGVELSTAKQGVRFGVSLRW